MNEETIRGLEDPIFGEPVDIEPEANYGILIGGMVSYDEERMAMAYKAAGDMLVEEALRSGDRSWEVGAPVLFLYRHTFELYLKWVVQPKGKNHDLLSLVEAADAIVARRFGKGFPVWAKARFLEFAHFDPRGTAFRYADGAQPCIGEECWIELHHLRQITKILTDGLTKLARLEQREQNITP